MRRGAGVFDVTPNPPGDEECTGDTDQEVETVKPRLQRVVFTPLLTQLLTCVRQRQTPRQ